MAKEVCFNNANGDEFILTAINIPGNSTRCVVKYARFVMSNLFKICLGRRCLEQVCHLKQQLPQVCKLICDLNRGGSINQWNRA